MEKPWKKIKGKILAFLPKAATPVSFQISPPLSPVKPGARMIPIIPKEARRKPKNSSFEQKEPASPKVSCMGQVKKNKCKPKLVVQPPAKKEKKISIVKILGDKKGCGKVNVDDHARGVAQRVPSLSQTKKHPSGHGGALENFDWRVCEEGGGGGGAGEVIIPCVGAIEPRKEVNLWKRRNRAPPIPLAM